MSAKTLPSSSVQTASIPHVEEKSAKKAKYILLNALTTQIREPTILRDQMPHPLLAGRDTTASLRAWTLLLLSRDPVRYSKYRSLVLAHFGPYPSSPSSPSTPSTPSTTTPLTFSTLKSLPSLNHLLHETLRLYPLIPLYSRVAIRDTILPVGGGIDEEFPVLVRKGETVN